VKIFISYSHEDKVQVGKIKRQLEIEYGFDVFLAHEDIAPTHKWVDEIISELRACDVFIAFLTKYFNNSDWTDQEVGFALARGVTIIPLKVGANPHGFIGQNQALTGYSKKVQSVCSEIIGILIESPKLREKLLNQLIKVFGKSSTFKRAESTFDNIMKFEDHLTIQQKNEIVRLAGKNIQVCGSKYGARKRALNFIYKYKDDLNKEVVEFFMSRKVV